MSNVLIVEDEKHLADGLRYNLEAEGYFVDTVSDAEAAFNKLQEEPRGYDVMVLDVMLPGMDGSEVLRRIRKENTSVPVLILSARRFPPRTVAVLR